jgi:putative ABC transport system permease protein
MVIGALTRQRGKHLMIAFTVGLGVSLATAMLGVMFDVGDKVNQELKSYGANLNIVPRGSSMVGDKYRFVDGEEPAMNANYIPEDELYKIKMIFWAYNIVDFAPYLTTMVKFVKIDNSATESLGKSGSVTNHDHSAHAAHKAHGVDAPGEGEALSKAEEDPKDSEGDYVNAFSDSYAKGKGAPSDGKAVEIAMVGTWFNKHLSLPTGEEVDAGMLPLKSWWRIEGEKGDDSDPTGAMVGREVAESLGLKLGESFQVESPKGEYILRVRGIFASGGEEDAEIFVPMALAQEASGLSGQVERVEVSALTTPENELSRRAALNPESLSQLEKDTWYCTAYISSIAYQIEEVLPGVRVKPVMRVSESEGPILQKTQLMIILLTALTLICSALAISNLVTANIMERAVEIGLMKALGATDLSISLLILTEMFIVSFLGGLFGYLAGLGFARFIGLRVFGESVTVPTVVIPLAVIMVIFVTVLGSIPALRALLQLRPTEVLHGR